MMQSRAASMAEAVVNLLVGYGISLLVQLLVFPIFDLHATLAENMTIGVIFSAASLLRSYMLRRLFEARRGWRLRALGPTSRRGAAGRRTGTEDTHARA
jgi:hypothetical protein